MTATLRCRLWSCIALMMPLAAVVANAQEYPNHPITMLCWPEAGSPNDVFARVIAKLTAKDLGQNVVVENRTRAEGIIAVNHLLRQPPDITEIETTNKKLGL